MKYRIFIPWSQDDNAFIAEISELPGCLADGASYIKGNDFCYKPKG
jgi:predicted RNase H-like HicB family nuclease